MTDQGHPKEKELRNHSLTQEVNDPEASYFEPVFGECSEPGIGSHSITGKGTPSLQGSHLHYSPGCWGQSLPHHPHW